MLSLVVLVVAALVAAAGGIDDFLERYAVLVCSDHGQTHVHRAARLQDHVQSPAIVTASNRAGMIYTEEPRVAAASLDGVDGVDATFFFEDGAVVARRGGDEDAAVLDEYPLGRERVEAALRNPNAGEVLVSAADGWEFADLGGTSPCRRRQPRVAHGRGLGGADARGRNRSPGADDRREGRDAREPALARSVIDGAGSEWSSSN